METLILALIASYNAHRQQEWVVAEPQEFQPFDLQALRNSADNKPSQASSRREAYVPQEAEKEQGHPKAVYWLISLAALLFLLVGILCLMESATLQTAGADQLGLAAGSVPSQGEVTFGQAVQALSVRH